MITLRPEDQVPVIEKLRDALKDHQAVLLRAACGFGKTVVAAYMAQRSSERRRRVVFACHRDSILNQTRGTFDKFGIKYGIIAAGYPSNPFAVAQIASADTLRNRLHLLKDCALFVVDEGHLWCSRTRKLLIEAARDAGAKIVVLTATPCRMDGKPLTEIADVMVLGPTEAEMIAAGNLADYEAYAPSRPELNGVHMRAGDYVTSELEGELDKPSVVGDAVETWKRYARGKRTVAYCISREHARHVQGAYLAAGIAAGYIDGNTPKTEQTQIANDFADGKIEVLASVELLTTGFDLSALVGRDVPIQCVQLLRPTKSLQLAIQMMMRCMRPQSGKAIILDHANIILNTDGTMNHGLPDSDREWSLEGGSVKRIEGVAAFDVTLCSDCFATYRASKPCCPYCSSERTVKPRAVNAVEGELKRIEKEALKAVAKTKRIEVGRTKDLPSLADIAIARNYKTGWLIKQAKAKGIHQMLPWKEACVAMANAKQRAESKAAA